MDEEIPNNSPQTGSSSTEFDIAPFPGLRPFREDETLVFFGREDHRRELLKRMSGTRFIAIVGTSGSGKSSLIQAGLIPDLNSGYLPKAGSDWVIICIEPREDPLGRLAAAFARHQWAVTPEELRTNSKKIVDLAGDLLGKDQHLLVLVDQFEELFRLRIRSHPVADHDEKASLVRLLLESGGQIPESLARKDDRIHVAIGLRSEFLGSAAAFRGLPEAIDQGQYLIPRLMREQVRRAIVSPIRVARGEIEKSLVQRVMNDLGDDQDQLPVLQHALQRTWDYWKDLTVRLPAMNNQCYEAIGGMTRALSDDASAGLETTKRVLGAEDGERIVKRVFQSLRETDVNGGQVRRPTTVSDLCEIAGCTTEQLEVALEPFRRRSFIRPVEGSFTPSTLVDVSHEALLRRWTLLRAWIEEDETDAQSYLRIARRAVEERDSTEPQYFTHPALPVLAKFWSERKPSRAWAIRRHPGYEDAKAFLDASSKRQKILDDDAARITAARIRQPYLIALGIAALVSVVIFLYLQDLSRRKSLETAVLVPVLANLTADDQLETRIQLAAELFTLAPALGADRMIEPVIRAAKPGSEVKIAAAKVALSKNADAIFIATKEGQLSAWNTGTGANLFSVRLPESTVPLNDRIDPVVLVAGSKLVVISDGLTIHDIQSGLQLGVVGIHPIRWAVSRDGKVAAFLEAGKLNLCDLTTDCKEIETHQVPDAVVQEIALSSDGSILAVFANTSANDVPEIVPIQTRPWKLLNPKELTAAGIVAMNMDDDLLHLCWRGKVATYKLDGSDLDDVGQPDPITPDALTCTFSSNLIATTHKGGSVRVWQTTASGLKQIALARTETRNSADVALAGSTMATSGQTVRLWNVTPLGQKLAVPLSSRFFANGSVLLAANKLIDVENGSAMATPAFADRNLRLWSLTDSMQNAVFSDGANMVFADMHPGGPPTQKWIFPTKKPVPTSIRADGKFVAFLLGDPAEDSGELAIVDASTGERTSTTKPATSFAFVPDKDQVLVLDRKEGIPRLWPLRGGPARDLSLSDATLPNGQPDIVAFSPDGKYLAVSEKVNSTSGTPSGSRGNTFWEVVLWHWPEVKLAGRFVHPSQVSAISFQKDSRALVALTFGGLAYPWDVESGHSLAHVPATGKISQAALTPSGSLAFIDDLGLRVLTLNPQSWFDESCNHIQRNLTPSEWQDLLGPNVPYHKTCPGLP